MAAAGYIVASVEYRTVRQNATVTEGLADVHAAIDDLIEQAESTASTRAGSALWGESAGGYLAGRWLTDARYVRS